MERLTRHAKDYLKFALAPIILLLAYIGFFLTYRSLGLPSPDQLIVLADRYYVEYGMWMLFAAAFVEGLLFVNWYVPGTSLIVIGIVFARRHGWDMVQVGGTVALALYLAFIVDYLLGLYGWHRLILRFGMKEPLERTQERLKRYGLPIIFSTYFQPNLASLVATSAGIFEEPFHKFLLYSAGALAFWTAVWGTVIYWFGPRLLEFVGVRFIFVILIAWLIALTVQFARKKGGHHVNVP